MELRGCFFSANQVDWRPFSFTLMGTSTLESPPQPQPNAAVVFEANVGLLLLLKLLLECVVAALFMRSWLARVGGMMTAALARGKT